MSSLPRLIATWRRVAGLLNDAAPRTSLAVVLFTLVEAVAGIGILYLIKLLVDSISLELANPASNNVTETMYFLVATGTAILFVALLQSISSILKMNQSLMVRDHVDREIHQRAIDVDLKFYESPAYYDALERAREGGSARPAQIVGTATSTFRAAIIIVGVFILLGTVELALLPALIIPVIIALAIRLSFTRKLFDWRMSKAQNERRASYLDWVMTHVVHAKDLRINDIGDHFRAQYTAIRLMLRRGELRIEQARLWAEFAMSVIGAAVFVGACAWLLNQSLTQNRPIGDVVLFVLLLRRAEGAGKEFVGNVSRLVDDHLYLRRLLDFLSVQPSITKPSNPLAIPNSINSGLILSDVSFRYEGCEDYALKNINLQIRPGQFLALVGENGSGKTTLIKLLTRLYDPTEGRIELDGVDIRKFDPREYRKLLSVIFQDYAMYAETVSENIRFGDVSLDSNSKMIETAADSAGAAQFISSLPLGFDTPLTKLFDNGQDLSVGQWQRVALARAMYPKSQFIIMDEPTSAMDPKAEFELFDNFKRRLNGRGAIVISHRLSTIRLADYTYVLDRGKIVEHGTHSSLVTEGGKYSDLFDKQARNYR